MPRPLSMFRSTPLAAAFLLALASAGAGCGDDEVTPPAVDAPATTFANPAEADSAAAGTIIEAGGGTEVLMPQMGESITEGTITKWLKKVGDSVQRDEPIFEISTDKVDAEIPSPAAGTLTEIKVPEGSTVTINTVVAVIGGGLSGLASAFALSNARHSVYVVEAAEAYGGQISTELSGGYVIEHGAEGFVARS